MDSPMSLTCMQTFYMQIWLDQLQFEGLLPVVANSAEADFRAIAHGVCAGEIRCWKSLLFAQGASYEVLLRG